MLRLETLDEVGDGRRFALAPEVPHRVAAVVDLPTHCLPCRARRPSTSRQRADRIAPRAAGALDPIIEDEALDPLTVRRTPKPRTAASQWMALPVSVARVA